MDDVTSTRGAHVGTVPSAREKIGRYARARDDFLTGVARQLTGDGRVAQLWTVGSLGRGDGDQLSDLDLVIVPNADHLPAILADPVTLVPLPSPILTRLRRDRNAPPGGAYTGICVEVATLPMWIDLYIWPPTSAAVPADATVLVDKILTATRQDPRGFIELLSAHQPPTHQDCPDDDDAADLLRVCVAAKYLARGNHAALARAINERTIDIDDPLAVANLLRSRVDATRARPQVRSLTNAWIDICFALRPLGQGGP
jgi:hypothetical protein